MKRIGALLLAVALLLCGCAGKEETEKTEDSNDVAIKAVKYHLYAKEQTVYCLDLSSGESTVLLTVEESADLDDLIADDSGKRMFFTVSNDLYCWNCDPDSEPVLVDRHVSQFRVNNRGDLVLYITEDDGCLYRYDLNESTKVGEANIFSMTPDGKRIIYGIRYNPEDVENSGRFYIVQDGKKAQLIENVEYIRASKDHSHIYYTTQYNPSEGKYSFDRQVYKWENGKSKKMDFSVSDFVVMGNGDVYFNSKQTPSVFYYNGNKVTQVHNGLDSISITKVSEYLCCYPSSEGMVIGYNGNAIDAGDGALNGAAPTLFWVDDTGKKVLVFDREEGSEQDNIYSITLGADGNLSKKLVQKNIDNSLWYTSILDENVVCSRDVIYIDGKMIVDQINDWCYERASKTLVYAEDGCLYRYQDGKKEKLTEVKNVKYIDCVPSGEIIFMCNYDSDEYTGDLYLYNANGATLIAEDIDWSYMPLTWSLSGVPGHLIFEGSSWGHRDGIVRG